MVLAWLFAGAHIAVEHGGDGIISHLSEAFHGHHHHDEEPVPAEDGHHHHDFGTEIVSQISKSSGQQVAAAAWISLYEGLKAELAALLHESDVCAEHSVVGDSPPDTRRSGWLFVVQTARPVRGPSLAA